MIKLLHFQWGRNGIYLGEDWKKISILVRIRTNFSQILLLFSIEFPKFRWGSILQFSPVPPSLIFFKKTKNFKNKKKLFVFHRSSHEVGSGVKVFQNWIYFSKCVILAISSWQVSLHASFSHLQWQYNGKTRIGPSFLKPIWLLEHALRDHTYKLI